MLDYVKSFLHCENGPRKRKVRKTSHFLVLLSKPASKSNINLVLLPFNYIHKVILSKRNERKNLETKQCTFIRLEGTVDVIKFF